MSARSLAVDRNDHAKLRHGREVHEGHLVNAEFSQYCPHFFTREGAALPLVGTYRGAAAFLIAGGPSFAEVDKAPLHSVSTKPTPPELPGDIHSDAGPNKAQ